MFEVGKKVIALRNTLQGVKEGEVRVVKDIHICSCGTGFLDVGCKNKEGQLGTYCHKCYEIINNTDHWFAHDIAFRPLDEWLEAEEAVKELTETIEV